VRYTAVSALSQIKPPSSLVAGALCKALADPDVVMRASIAALLGELDPPPVEAGDALASLLSDASERVREAARKSLDRIRKEAEKEIK